jgi:hypothetical protein
MNIFALDTDVNLAAQYHVNRHAVKMIVEYSQLLSTAHRILDGVSEQRLSKTGRRTTSWRLEDEREQILYLASHVNHPSGVWCRKTSENYKWLHSLLVALTKEYTYRYGNIHKVESSGLLDKLGQLPNNIPIGELTPVSLAMPDEYKLPDFVESYRNYYRNGKKHLHNWIGRVNSRNQPSWI